jgi:hypothetical protein
VTPSAAAASSMLNISVSIPHWPHQREADCLLLRIKIVSVVSTEISVVTLLLRVFKRPPQKPSGNGRPLANEHSLDLESAHLPSSRIRSVRDIHARISPSLSFRNSEIPLKKL